MAPDQARAALQQALLEISEHSMCAGWYGDLEYIVWDRLGRGASRLGQVVLTEMLLARLQRLSEAAGGWFVSPEDDGIDGPVFVERETWLHMYTGWLLQVPESMRPRDR